MYDGSFDNKNIADKLLLVLLIKVVKFLGILKNDLFRDDKKFKKYAMKLLQLFLPLIISLHVFFFFQRRNLTWCGVAIKLDGAMKNLNCHFNLSSTEI